MPLSPAEPPQGLSETEARRRLAQDGPNELPGGQRRSGGRLLLELVKEPMLALLLACATLYGLLGERGDALMLLVAVAAVITITVLQERRTEQALAALRQLASPHAQVLRDGQWQRRPARELVRGDLVRLREGERVPADAELVEARLLQVDESLLSGESVAVPKDADSAADASTRQVFAGTLVTRGEGLAQVTATGPRSQMGRIGEALGSIAETDSPLQREAASLVRRMGLAALAVCSVVVLMLGLVRHDWLGALLAGLALAMGMLPEEVPVVLTVFMALGAWRMSRQQVLTRRLASLETLGAATVLCTDKTGTLTENRMQVVQLALAEAPAEGPLQLRLLDPVRPEAAALVAVARAATPPASADPMETAILALPAATPPAADTLRREYPLAPELLAMSRVWQAADGPCWLAAKGAPEAIAALCHLDGAAQAALATSVARLADEGLRVLGVARADLGHDTRPVSADTAAAEGQHGYAFRFLGLLALADPLRASVPQALAQARGAGVRVLMITGDHPATARAIGRQAGFGEAPQLLTGAEIDTLDDAALAERLRHTDVVARAVPAHKLRIVRALQARGEVVAMTGDGVNDAPALKAADIGVAMGGRGTDVAREAADLVIANDDFSALVQAVRMGRRLDSHLRRAMGFVVAVHVPVAGLALLAVGLGWPLLLLPAHIALLELLIDPACTVVFEMEPDDPASMRQPPRAAGRPLLDRTLLLGSLGLGSVVLAAVAGAAAWARHAGWDEAAVRSLAFGLLLLGDLGLIAALLRPGAGLRGLMAGGNPAWWAALLAVPAALALMLGVPPVAHLLRLAPVGGLEAGALLLGGLLLWEGLRRLGARWRLR